MKYVQEPIKIKEGDPLTGDEYSHPAFGQVSLSFVSGKTNLYDAEFTSGGFVQIDVKTSTLNRHQSRDWHMPQSLLVSFNMSHAQFVSLVSSANRGSGVPVTLTYANGERISELPSPKDEVKDYSAEALRCMNTARGLLKDLKAEIEESNLSTKKKNEILNKIDLTDYSIASNIDHAAKQFGEKLEGAVERAKVDVNRYVDSVITDVGMKAVGAHLSSEEPTKLFNSKV